MAKKASGASCSMCCRPRCGCAWGLLLLGVLFLLRDFGVWNFWNIQPWTVVFLLLGLCFLCKK